MEVPAPRDVRPAAIDLGMGNAARIAGAGRLLRRRGSHGAQAALERSAMNLKTTVTLLVLSIAGAAYWASSTALGTRGSGSGTLKVLKNDITEDQLTRIEIRRGPNHLILERKPKGEWSLPGNWAVR